METGKIWMRGITFKLDGSTSTWSAEFIFNAVKEVFTKAKKEEKRTSKFGLRVDIFVDSDNLNAAFAMVKGFASHAMFC